ncbi:WhiB family transcriptional regulator [Corynebacterium ulcerans]|uniref:WhiB family transcriptional regulator n=1 Tax=Corynebacterium ulcerans TaxID=65058 RepID=UPI000C7803AB|nr:WhiB family transcriptional regulator [Corynebacterium ulcerans]PLV98368.1 WhiB family transcriptional regulator [Corynebacterium ulcerans]
MTTSLMNVRKISPLEEDALGSLRALERGDWVMYAHCRNEDPDALFVRGAAQRRAAAICSECPVMMRCRADALDNRVEFGVWGGLTERQRRSILRNNPDIESWRDFFAHGGELAGI